MSTEIAGFCKNFEWALAGNRTVLLHRIVNTRATITLLLSYICETMAIIYLTKYEPMRPLPAPHVPGKTEFERFDNAMRKVLTVSKTELLRREAVEKQARERSSNAKSKKAR